MKKYLLGIAFAALLSLSFCSCNNEGPAEYPCGSFVDANNNEICDRCGYTAIKHNPPEGIGYNICKNDSGKS